MSLGKPGGDGKTRLRRGSRISRVAARRAESHRKIRL